MYIQLTEKCNMTCGHCCFAATSRGRVMSSAVFSKALEIARNFGDYVTLGGGEPLMHRSFFRFLEEALEDADDIETSVLVVTNGSLTERAYRLLQVIEDMEDNMRPAKHLMVSLSRDEWHDPIDPRLLALWTRKAKEYYSALSVHHYSSCRTYTPPAQHVEIRTVSHLVNHGRAKENNLSKNNECLCETPFVDPTGDLWSCGCRTHLIGNIMSETIYLWDFEIGCRNDPDSFYSTTNRDEPKCL